MDDRKGISHLIEQQLEAALAQKELEALLADGKEHRMTYINAVFLDDISLQESAFRPVFVTGIVKSAKEFDERMSVLMNALTNAGLDFYESKLLLVRAACHAGMLVSKAVLENDKETTKAAAFFLSRVCSHFAVNGSLDNLPESELGDIGLRAREFMETHPLSASEFKELMLREPEGDESAESGK